MTDEELVARLEAWEPLVSSGHIVSRAGQDLRQAADRIKALTAEMERLRHFVAYTAEFCNDAHIAGKAFAALEKQP